MDYRLDIARKAANSETLNLNTTDVVQEIRDRTEGRGADVCVDAVGMEANRSPWEKLSNLLHLQAGTISVIKLCASAVRRGGIISIVGVYASPYSNFPLGQIFDKGVTIKMGQAPVQHYIDELLELVKTRKVILNDIVTHTLPLERAAHAYDIFLKKEDNCLKVILKPGG